MSIPAEVRIYEVGPRDGLQNEKVILPTAVKVTLIDMLSDSGLTHIEATSFVSPKWVPQMADADEVMARIKRRTGVSYPVLVPNERGMEAALAAGVTEVAVFAAASESFSRKNINCSIAESIERFHPVIALAQANDVRVRGYVSCVAGCPYEGEVAPQKVADVTMMLAQAGCYEISLGDTIGIGTQDSMAAMLDSVQAQIDTGMLALHCHATYGRALENIRVGLTRGIAVIDSAVGGLGGCPYAPGASGNVATEDVLALLDGMGIQTGVDKGVIDDAARFIRTALAE